MEKNREHTGKFRLVFDILFVISIIAIVMADRVATKKYRESQNKAEIGASKEQVDTIYTLDLHLANYGLKMPNKGNIYNLMELLNVEHKDIAYAQMVLESANMTSNLSKSNNNFFGMKHPKIRQNVSLGEKNGYASYHSWAYSLYDYRLWQMEFASGLSEEDYYACLQSRYAEDTEYTSKLRRIIKNNSL